MRWCRHEPQRPGGTSITTRLSAGGAGRIRAAAACALRFSGPRKDQLSPTPTPRSELRISGSQIAPPRIWIESTSRISRPGTPSTAAGTTQTARSSKEPRDTSTVIEPERSSPATSNGSVAARAPPVPGSAALGSDGDPVPPPLGAAAEAVTTAAGASETVVDPDGRMDPDETGEGSWVGFGVAVGVGDATGGTTSVGVGSEATGTDGSGNDGMSDVMGTVGSGSVGSVSVGGAVGEGVRVGAAVGV